LAAIWPLIPTFISYVISFIFIGIYWNNHHHLLQVAQKVNGAILWANLHLLFWLSLIPFFTAWMGEHNFAAWPVALYGVNLLMLGVAYYILDLCLIKAHGRDSKLGQAIGIGYKEIVSMVVYAVGIPLAFYNSIISYVLFGCVALMWLVPDRRIEKVLEK
jgi:uncharacterized membrane protein